MAVNSLAVVDFGEPDDNPTNVPTYVACRSLSASGAKSITVPANATYVRLAGTADFFVSYTLAGATNSNTAIVGVDDDTGASNELLKANEATWRICSSVSGLSVITTATTAIVTATFFGR